jgi:hypothetical protein
MYVCMGVCMYSVRVCDRKTAKEISSRKRASRPFRKRDRDRGREGVSEREREREGALFNGIHSHIQNILLLLQVTAKVQAAEGVVDVEKKSRKWKWR